MGMSQRSIGGASFILSATFFWLTWFLMPEPGTTDAAFILQAIAEQRGHVLLSAILQTICAVAIVLGVLAIRPPHSRLGTDWHRPHTGRRPWQRRGRRLSPDGVQMTAPNVDRAAMFPVMTRMQTQQVWLLVPLLLSFLPGVTCLCIGLAREGRGPSGVGRLFASALAVGLAGAVAARTFGISPRPLTMTALALFSGAIGWTGWTMWRTPEA